MTDATPTPDELVSAYVDGEATPEERRAVEADPELLARAQLFRTLGQRVGEPVPPPPVGHRDTAIAAALAASPTVTDTVRSLDVARERRRSPRVIAIASVAAVVALVLLVVPIVLDSGGNEVDFAAEDTADEAASEEPAAEEIQAADADGGDAADVGESLDDGVALDLPAEAAAVTAEEPAEAAAAEPAFEEPAFEEEAAADAEAGFADDAGDDALNARAFDVGAFADAEQLAAAARELVTEADRESTTPDATVCPDSIAQTVAVRDVVLEVDGVLEGDAVVAVIVRSTDVDGAVIERTVVVETATCGVVLVSDG